jgi:hypothetical protein
MAQMAHQPILKMETSEKFVCAQHLVGVGEVRIYLIEFGPSINLVATRIKHCGEYRN